MSVFLSFSVVIPTYNRAHLVPLTIDSILAQRYEHFEVIVVDDGSTDNTEEVLKRYLADGRFRYFKKTNAERGAARNFGFARAKGDYVFFIDSDDLMMEDHLSVLNKAIGALPEKPDFVAPGFTIVNPDGSFNYEGHSFKKGWYHKSIILKGNPFACLIAVRKDNPNLIPYNEDRNLAIMEDWIFLAQNLQHSKLYVLDEITIKMVEHPQRSMADNLAVIKKRGRATSYLLNNVAFDPGERKTLKAFSDYFCAVHASIEGKKRMAFSYLFKAAPRIPVKKTVSLSIKLIVGKRIFQWLKKIVRTFSS
ncbi:MAG TPA: glycosyltransferase family A protein [Chitinophagaceae bacterium]